MPDPVRPFLSATGRGLKSFRVAAAEFLRERGFAPVVQEEFDCTYQEIRHLLRDQIAPCDVVVLLVGPAYGCQPLNWPDHLPRRSYTQLEYDLALELGKPVYLFFASPSCLLDPFAEEPAEDRQRQRDYVAALKHGDRVWYEFDSPDGLLRLLGNTKFHRAVRPNLPFASLGSLFKGRDDVLTQVRQTLLTRPAHAAAVTARQAIHGLGGVGKTRLAIEYAYRYASEYSARLYATADSPFALEANLAALCRADVLDLPEQIAKEQDVQLEAVLRWLRQHAGWLLILDNVDTPEAQAAVQGVLGKAMTGHVLITSRRSELWPADVTTIELDTLSIPASAEFLLDRTAPNPAAPTKPHRRVTSTDAAEAERLAADLDGLALALEQAGAYVAMNRITFAEYRARLRDVEGEVLTWFDEAAMNYPRSVAVTWQASVNQLYDDGRRMLNLLAWLAPDPIPVDMMRAEPTATDVVYSPVRNRERALADLAAYSLVKWNVDASTISVHRLVQDASRYQMLSAERDGSLRDALGAVGSYSTAAAGEPSDPRSWPVWDLLHPHAVTLANHGDQAEIAAPTASLFANSGMYLRARARYAEAEPLCRRAIVLDEAHFGQDHPEVALHLNILAQLLQTTNRPGEAEPLYRRALSTYEASLGPDHSDVAAVLINLAGLLLATNRHTEGEPLCRRAVRILIATFDDDHPRIAPGLLTLAALLRATNRHTEAEPLCRRAVGVLEAALGPDHPDLASALNTLAVLLGETNRHAEAEPLYRRALAIDEASLGPDHPKVAIRLNNLAGLLHATNRHPEAESLHRRALAINEASLGPDHPHVARDLNNLAEVLRATNRPGEAEPLYRRALAIDEASLGPDHPDVARDLNNLALSLCATNRSGEAEPLYRRALAIDEASLGPDHPYVAGGLINLAGLLRATNRHTEAEPLCRRAVGVLEAALGPDHPDLASALNMLAVLLDDSNRHAEAEPLYRRALAIDEASLGPDHPKVAIRLNNLAGLLHATNRHPEAEPLYKRSVRILYQFQVAGDQVHPDFNTCVSNYLNCLTASQSLSEEQATAHLLELLGLDE